MSYVIQSIPLEYLVRANGSNNMGQSFNTGALPIGGYKVMGVQVVVVQGDAEGTIRIQESNDAANWVMCPAAPYGAQCNVTSGVSFSFVFNLSAIGGAYLRAEWDRTSGDGQLDISVMLKE